MSEQVMEREKASGPVWWHAGTERHWWVNSEWQGAETQLSLSLSVLAFSLSLPPSLSLSFSYSPLTPQASHSAPCFHFVHNIKNLDHVWKASFVSPHSINWRHEGFIITHQSTTLCFIQSCVHTLWPEIQRKKIRNIASRLIVTFTNVTSLFLTCTTVHIFTYFMSVCLIQHIMLAHQIPMCYGI